MNQGPKEEIEIERSLRPYFEMLEAKYSKVTTVEWRKLVGRTATTICDKPERFLKKRIVIGHHTAQVILEDRRVQMFDYRIPVCNIQKFSGFIFNCPDEAKP